MVLSAARVRAMALLAACRSLARGKGTALSSCPWPPGRQRIHQPGRQSEERQPPVDSAARPSTDPSTQGEPRPPLGWAAGAVTSSRSPAAVRPRRRSGTPQARPAARRSKRARSRPIVPGSTSSRNRTATSGNRVSSRRASTRSTLGTRACRSRRPLTPDASPRCPASPDPPPRQPPPSQPAGRLWRTAIVCPAPAGSAPARGRPAPERAAVSAAGWR